MIQNKNKILVLGHEGMLGHMVAKFLQKKGFETLLLGGRWPENNFKEKILQKECDFIINCIGAIPQKKKNFEINWELPIWLDQHVNSKILHPGTDCEMDLDDYGISKKKASDYLLENSVKTKIIKTSIIGPEVSSNSSLMCWFLGNPDGTKVRGFNSHFWNGNTTLTWAKFAEEIIRDWDLHSNLNILYSECVTKFDLLNHLNEIYDRKIIIEKFESKIVNKCLSGNIKTPHIKQQILDLKKFYA